MIRSRHALVLALLATVGLAACTEAPHRDDAAAPDITVVPNHRTVLTGESIVVTASTKNLVGTSAIRWTVTPTTGHVRARENNGLIAMFTADEPGTYLITASADAGNGRWVQSSANVTVNGLGLGNTNGSANNGNYNNDNYNNANANSGNYNNPNNPNYNNNPNNPNNPNYNRNNANNNNGNNNNNASNR